MPVYWKTKIIQEKIQVFFFDETFSEPTHARVILIGFYNSAIGKIITIMI